MTQKAATLICTLALWASALTGAQDQTTEARAPTLGRLVGAYRYTGDAQSDEQRINEQIEGAIKNMNVLIRRKARSKLENVNSIIKVVRIATRGDEVTVVLDQLTVTAPTDGTKRSIKTPNGESAQAFFHVESASLIQEIEQTNATRRNTFRFDEAGRLVMRVQETSSRLSAPVQYELSYLAAGK